MVRQGHREGQMAKTKLNQSKLKFMIKAEQHQKIIIEYKKAKQRGSNILKFLNEEEGFSIGQDLRAFDQLKTKQK